jgi:hypothetical protein
MVLCGFNRILMMEKLGSFCMFGDRNWLQHYDKFAETNLRQTWPSRSCFNLTGSCDEALGLKMIKIETPTQL